jgi:hypothetical protein
MLRLIKRGRENLEPVLQEEGVLTRTVVAVGPAF